MEQTNEDQHPLSRAAAAAGMTITALADHLGVTRGAVQQWKLEGRRTPAEHCPKIERLCKRAVLSEELNDRVDWAYIRSDDSGKAQ